jgi:NAD(P)-dependent dehydrogenase (short-subunit alcohol dehydrogenase family)
LLTYKNDAHPERGVYAELGRGNASRSLSRRAGQPADVANLVGFLVTPEAFYVNGQSIVIDGGMSALTVRVRSRL